MLHGDLMLAQAYHRFDVDEVMPRHSSSMFLIHIWHANIPSAGWCGNACAFEQSVTGLANVEGLDAQQYDLLQPLPCLGHAIVVTRCSMMSSACAKQRNMVRSAWQQVESTAAAGSMQMHGPIGHPAALRMEQMLACRAGRRCKG